MIKARRRFGIFRRLGIGDIFADVCCCVLFRGYGSYMNTSGSNLSLFNTKISPRGLNVWVVLICAWGFWFVILLPSLMYTGRKIKLRYTVKQSKSKTEISLKMDKEKTRRVNGWTIVAKDCRQSFLSSFHGILNIKKIAGISSLASVYSYREIMRDYTKTKQAL